MIVPQSFYQSEDVVEVARDLLGKVLVTQSGKTKTSGIIFETEAYCGLTDRACHAWPEKRTPRTQVFYESGGLAYVYLCYGIHQLFNIVTGPENIPQAVLIRSVLPLEGLGLIEKRRGGPRKVLLDGPGKLTQGLGIKGEWNRWPLFKGQKIWVEDRGIAVGEVAKSPRIGIDYAGEDARLPWRFVAEIKRPTLD